MGIHTLSGSLGKVLTRSGWSAFLPFLGTGEGAPALLFPCAALRSPTAVPRLLHNPPGSASRALGIFRSASGASDTVHTPAIVKAAPRGIDVMVHPGFGGDRFLVNKLGTPLL